MESLNKFINETGIYSLEDLKSDYESNSRSHWFDDDTLRFFKSRFSNDLFYKPESNLIYFVSSEKGPNNIRAYSVRSYHVLSKDIDTIQDFQGFKTSSSAKAYCKKLIKKASNET